MELKFSSWFLSSFVRNKVRIIKLKYVVVTSFYQQHEIFIMILLLNNMALVIVANSLILWKSKKIMLNYF